MRRAPKSFRLHIGLFGRRNAGKSSLVNAMTRQDVSIVSDVAGTTTDPVEKPMELLPIGPVLFIDTAGIDDVGALGELRAKRTRQVFDRTDVGIIVVDAGRWSEFEDRIAQELRRREVPTIAAFNKADLGRLTVTRPAILPDPVEVFDAPPSAPPGELFARAWIDAIGNDSPPVVLPEQALAVTRILEAIYMSAQTGKEISL